MLKNVQAMCVRGVTTQYTNLKHQYVFVIFCSPVSTFDERCQKQQESTSQCDWMWHCPIRNQIPLVLWIVQYAYKKTLTIKNHRSAPNLSSTSATVRLVIFTSNKFITSPLFRSIDHLRNFVVSICWLSKTLDQLWLSRHNNDLLFLNASFHRYVCPHHKGRYPCWFDNNIAKAVSCMDAVLPSLFYLEIINPF